MNRPVRTKSSRTRSLSINSPRITYRQLHGIVLLDKPMGLSSNEALQAVRSLFRAAKGGHAGALDPLATGLLPLCFGEATKLAGNLLGSRKGYIAECKLGITTDTADLEGEILRQRDVPTLDDTMIEAALAQLRGRITQIPPMYSAVKLDGERLYEKARRGETVDVPAREVEVFRLELLARAGDVLRLYVECGSGMYVRTLAESLGEALGCGAHITALRRLWVEPFVEPAMVTLEQLQQASVQSDEALLTWLQPVAAGLSHLPALMLDDTQTMAISQGQPLQLEAPFEVGRCAAFATDGALLASLEVDKSGRTRVQRGFNLPPGA